MFKNQSAKRAFMFIRDYFVRFAFYIVALEKKIATKTQPQKKFLLHKQLTELKKKQHNG